MSGLRDRFVYESIWEHINAELTAKDWFALDDTHTPITVTYSFPDDEEPVEYNTLALTTGMQDSEYVEMGSLDYEKNVIYYIDFYAESDSLGMHLIGDLEHFLKKTPAMDVYDYENAKAVIASAQVGGVFTRRPVRVTQPWQKHWYTLSFDIEDGIR